jgi:hypothetical protein
MTIPISFFKAPVVRDRWFKVEAIFQKALNHFSEDLDQVSHFCGCFGGDEPHPFLPSPREPGLCAGRLSSRPETSARSVGRVGPMGKPLTFKPGKAEGLTPAAESHGLWPWMNARTFGRDVAPHGRWSGATSFARGAPLVSPPVTAVGVSVGVVVWVRIIIGIWAIIGIWIIIGIRVRVRI